MDSESDNIIANINLVDIYKEKSKQYICKVRPSTKNMIVK